MKKLAILVPAIVAALISAPSAGAAPVGGMRVATAERYYVKETWHALGSSKGGPGAVYVFEASVKTTDGTPAGAVDAYYTNLRASVFLNATVVLTNGTLVLAGSYPANGKRRVALITGGTGRYANARGTVTLTAAGDRGDLAVVAFSR